MPNISASDYTSYIKYKAAAVSYANNRPPRAIQTVDQVSPNVAILNSIVKASQASYLVDPTLTTIQGLASVRPQPPNNVNHPQAKSSVSYAGMGPAASLPAAANGACCGPKTA